MKKLIIILAAILGLAASCSIEPPEGQLECQTSDECPESWFCDTDNFCYKSSGDDTAEPADSDSQTDTAESADSDT
jgi:hypothetical protein